MKDFGLGTKNIQKNAHHLLSSFDRRWYVQARLSTTSRDQMFYDIMVTDVAWDGRVLRVNGKNVSNTTSFDQAAKRALPLIQGDPHVKNNKHDSCRTPPLPRVTSALRSRICIACRRRTVFSRHERRKARLKHRVCSR